MEVSLAERKYLRILLFEKQCLQQEQEKENFKFKMIAFRKIRYFIRMSHNLLPLLFINFILQKIKYNFIELLPYNLH